MVIVLKAKVSNMRIDQYLTEELKLSRSKIQKLLKEEKILVNNSKVNANYIVKLDDDITVIDLDLEPPKLVAENIKLDVLYEDDYLMIINKKSGMVVHPAPGNYSKTLVNALLYNKKLSKGEGFRPGIVHRLDKDTSGLLIVAKDDKTHDLLSKMLAKHEIERVYYALLSGVIPHETGTIDAPIGRSDKNRQKMDVTDVNSKEAITHFKVLKRFTENTLVECRLETGRTHQIRVHFAYIKHPVVNDPLYGNTKKTTSFGQLLHSKEIKFIHPITNKEISIDSSLPEEFKDYLSTLE